MLEVGCAKSFLALERGAKGMADAASGRARGDIQLAN